MAQEDHIEIPSHAAVLVFSEHGLQIIIEEFSSKDLVPNYVRYAAAVMEFANTEEGAQTINEFHNERVKTRRKGLN